jgi:hypothetical protein
VKTSAPCPACGKPLTVLGVARAPTPLHLRCPHCLRPLRVKNLTLPVVIAGIAFGVLLGEKLLEQARVEGGVPVKAVLLGLALVVAFDLLVSFTVVNWGKITKRDP